VADFLSRLVSRELGTACVLVPRRATFFEDDVQATQLSAHDTPQDSEHVEVGRFGDPSGQRGYPVPASPSPEQAASWEMSPNGVHVGAHSAVKSSAGSEKSPPPARNNIEVERHDFPNVPVPGSMGKEPSGEQTSSIPLIEQSPPVLGGAAATPPPPLIGPPARDFGDPHRASTATAGQRPLAAEQGEQPLGVPDNDDVPRSNVRGSRAEGAARFQTLDSATPMEDRGVAAPVYHPTLAHATGHEEVRRMLHLPAPPFRETAAAAEPNIQVTIGRVEVRASTSPPSPPRRAHVPQVMGLAEYLRQRAEERRR
jgi:hypothetical protein